MPTTSASMIQITSNQYFLVGVAEIVIDVSMLLNDSVNEPAPLRQSMAMSRGRRARCSGVVRRTVHGAKVNPRRFWAKPSARWNIGKGANAKGTVIHLSHPGCPFHPNKVHQIPPENVSAAIKASSTASPMGRMVAPGATRKNNNPRRVADNVPPTVITAADLR